jgi:hypothetical protein
MTALSREEDTLCIGQIKSRMHPPHNVLQRIVRHNDTALDYYRLPAGLTTESHHRLSRERSVCMEFIVFVIKIIISCTIKGLPCISRKSTHRACEYKSV